MKGRLNFQDYLQILNKLKAENNVEQWFELSINIILNVQTENDNLFVLNQDLIQNIKNLSLSSVQQAEKLQIAENIRATEIAIWKQKDIIKTTEIAVLKHDMLETQQKINTMIQTFKDYCGAYDAEIALKCENINEIKHQSKTLLNEHNQQIKTYELEILWLKAAQKEIE
ncbi:Hypothetical_protein [Hexamita inflata]|uniref:Hypothetical_protein n=1 Tax=Hexamita inflata TaxID=28002 RepID=A0AA86UHD4_9EUKA|nr:Hypothetical protein HINF_LOCUS39616 [Hexamita inflata]